MNKIVAFGNPLLDTIVLIKNDILLKKYNLKADGQKEISHEEMKSLKADIKSLEKSVSAGGCAQNTLKVFQWLCQQQNVAIIFGAVGNDEEGKYLEQLLQEQGVNTKYVIHNSHPTGSSVALSLGDSRSLIAHLGAAEVMSVTDFQSNVNILKEIKDCNLVYIEGFFLTKRTDVASCILDFCISLNKVIAFNLSGEYLCKEYAEDVLTFVKHSAIIFGNRKELQTLCTFTNENNVENVIKKFGKQGKVVAITNGSSSILCVDDKSGFLEVTIPDLKHEEIVDTTGAGDSFVAGFLTGYLLKKSLRECVNLGCYAAQEIIIRRGCTIPDYSPNVDLS